MGKRYPVRYDDEWIVAHRASAQNWRAVCNEYNKAHGTYVNYNTFRSHCNIIGLNRIDINFRYSDEQIEWLKENYPILGRVKTTKAFNEKFKDNKTSRAIGRKCILMGLRVTEGRKKERAIENTGRYHEVGTVSIGANGDPYVKKESGWIPVKYIVAGKQKEKILVHLDGDKSNNSLKNLTFITRKVSARMLENRFWSKNPEITRTGIICCELEQALKEK